jgi:cysteine sulfinate desulfinase/cysteine desulfurase-like protein
MGIGRSRALGALRCTFGELNVAAHGAALAAAVSTLVPALRTASAAIRA